MNPEQELRTLIGEAAAAHPQIGRLQESVKWGQPSFAPARPGIGSSVRIQDNRDGTFALMFICHTGLVEYFRDLYPGELNYLGNRGIIFDPQAPFDREAARHCISQALTCKLARKERG